MNFPYFTCPACKIDLCELIREPDSANPVRDDSGQKVLIKCHCCGLFEFRDPLSLNILRSAYESHQTTIDGDHPCPHCKYNLRTLRIGAMCPECGKPIQRPSPGRPITREHDEFHEPLRTSVLTYMLLCGVLVLPWLPKSDRIHAAIAIAGAASIVYGVRAISRKRIVMFPNWGEGRWRGGAAIIGGVIYLIIGGALLGLAAGMHLGYIR